LPPARGRRQHRALEAATLAEVTRSRVGHVSHDKPAPGIWAVVSVLTGGAGVLAYLAAWAIIPGEGQKSPIDENIVSKKGSR
jgi:hypothetical protein